MQSTNFHRLIRFAVIFLSLIGTGATAPVEIVGTLRNVNGDPLSGRISVFQEVPHLAANYYKVDKTGSFRITTDSRGELVIHAVAAHHASAERVLPSGASGTISINFALPLAQNIHGRVVDALGNGVPDAVVQIRYHEPDKPVRRLLFGPDERTDGDGRFLIPDVGIKVPFVVDVLAPDYPPVSSERMEMADGEAELETIILRQQGASVMVQVLDVADRAVGDATVMLLADPAGLAARSRGSWLHHRAFRQRGVTSRLGNVRFRGVPPGRIIVRVKAAGAAAEHRAVVVGGQEFRITLRIL